MTIWPKTWPWRILCSLLLAFFVYSAGAYFGVPWLVRQLMENQAASALHRSVSASEIKFNPYELRLSIVDLNVRERGGSRDFIQIAHISVRLSWTSLTHLAFVVKNLGIERPLIRIERRDASSFNFSDLLESGAQNKGWSFAISNIQVTDGLILFTDKVLKKEHRLDNIRLAIPFIANLPIDADIYVQPMLQMKVDGSPFTLTGKTKLFRGTLESVIELSFQRLDVTRFAGYLADKLPFNLKQAELTAVLQLHFIQLAAKPQLQMAGAITLDNVAISDRRDSPLAQLKQLQATITEFDPLTSNLKISFVVIDSLSLHLVINRDGKTNLAAFYVGSGAPRPLALQTAKHSTTLPSQNPIIQAAPPSPPLLNPLAAAPRSGSSTTAASSSGSDQNAGVVANSHFRLSVASLELNNSRLEIADKSGPTPSAFELLGIHLGLKNLATTGKVPASYTFRASLKSGGRLAADGSFDVSSSQVTGNVSLDKIDLPALQNVVARIIPGTITAGELTGQATVRVTVGSRVNFHAEPARIALDGVELRPPNQTQNIIGWKHAAAKLDQADLASHQAVLRELRTDGLHLTALIDSQGKLNLISLLYAQPTAGKQTAQIGADAHSSGWQYRIESLVLENADAWIEDDAQQQPFSMRFAPLNLTLRGLSSDFAKPFTVELDGNTVRGGSLKANGRTAINPFHSQLHLTAERIYLASLDPLITDVLAPSRLNAKITSGRLTTSGIVEMQASDGTFDASYQGGVRLGGVRISDNLTGVSFFRWHALNLDNFVMRYGAPHARFQLGNITLSDFYTGLILNADGRLNLANVISSPEQPPVPVTQPAVRSSSKAAPPAISPDITVGSFTVQNGQVSYLDNFIKPNYSAVMTQLDGRVGGFGANSTEPAEVLLTGKVNRTSPISISGSINPLAPMASLDLQANARRIELPPLTPYAAKYTGYPITGGTLSGNVHYKLAKQHLTANNHLILDQLTFGERAENSTARNLPIRLAIAVLKDSQGRIDLSIPVSGSLSDPNFDLGRLIWQGLENVIIKAAAAPFTTLASTVGGAKQNLSYIAFAPGYSNLSQPRQNKLEILAASLTQRPSLKLRITARVDPRIDIQGLREATLENEIKREKAKNEQLATTPGAIEQVELTPDEYDRYLWRVYKNANFAKPRDLVGMVKRVDPSEMKKLMLTNIKVTDTDLRQLAEARAQTVYQLLNARIRQSRLLVAPPKLNAEGITEGPTTRVDFSLE